MRELRRALNVQWQAVWPLQVSGLAGALSILVGIAVLEGWWSGNLRLVQPLSGLPAMVPNTALCAILLGTSLLLLGHSQVRRFTRCVAQVCAVVVMALGALTLAEYALGLNLWIDSYPFFVNPLFAEHGFAPRRSGQGSAAAFFLLGLAVLTLDIKRAVRIDLSEVLAVSAALIATITAAGYLYGATTLYEARMPYTGMAPHTVLVAFVLSAGVICLRPERSLIGLVRSPQAGGFVVRRLLVGTSAIPILGLVVLIGLRGSLYEEPFAAALLAVAAIAIAMVLVIATGRALDRMDIARTASERALAEREERLRDLIQQASDGVLIADLQGRYTEVNDAACRMLGHPREEIVGRTIGDFLVSDERPRVEAAKAALLRGDVEMDEWTLNRRDGSRLPVEGSMKILPDGRWQVLMRDISTRREVERASDAVAEAVTGSPQSSLQAVLETIALEARIVANAEYAAFGIGGDSEHPFDPWVFVGI